MKKALIAIPLQFSNKTMFTITLTSPLINKNVYFLHKHNASFCIHNFKAQSLTQILFSIEGQPVPEVARRKVYQSTRINGTRENIRKKMDLLEQENQVLKEDMAIMQAKINEMAAMQTQVDELTELVGTLRAAQNLPPPPPPINTQAEAGPSTIPGCTMSFNTPHQTIPEGRP